MGPRRQPRQLMHPVDRPTRGWGRVGPKTSRKIARAQWGRLAARTGGSNARECRGRVSLTHPPPAAPRRRSGVSSSETAAGAAVFPKAVLARCASNAAASPWLLRGSIVGSEARRRDLRLSCAAAESRLPSSGSPVAASATAFPSVVLWCDNGGEVRGRRAGVFLARPRRQRRRQGGARPPWRSCSVMASGG